MWYIYIILCHNNSLYTGISDNPEKRFLDHVAGKGAKYTKSYKPVKIIYQEEASSRSSAQKRELEIKSWNRQKKIATLKLTLQ